MKNNNGCNGNDNNSNNNNNSFAGMNALDLREGLVGRLNNTRKLTSWGELKGVGSQETKFSPWLSQVFFGSLAFFWGWGVHKARGVHRG